jgi:hypothetical protein
VAGYSPLSVINIRPQAMDANIGMAMSDGRWQRFSAIEQAGPPDQPLSCANPMKMMEIVARVAAMTIAEIPRVRIMALEM